MSDLLEQLGGDGASDEGDWDIVHPPKWAAISALALGGASVVIGFTLGGSIDWLGWALGFAAIVSGIVYRWVLRQRQILRGFSPDYILGRLMLTGVFLGFTGIVINALYLAQRATP